MRLHELLQLILLLQLITRREALLLLPHVEHHLLDSRSGLAIKVGQLRWFGVDLLSVDLDIALNSSTPPTVLVLPFLDVDVQVLSFVVVQLSVLNRPVSFLSVDFVFPFSVDQGHAVDKDSQLVKSDGDFQVLLGDCSVKEDEHFQVLNK